VILTAVVLQLLLPAAVLAWLAWADVRSAAAAIGAVLALAGVLLAAALVVPALFLPWWLPAACAAVALLVIVIRVPAWRRSCTRLWPDAPGGRLLFAAGCCVAAGAAALVIVALDGRRLPDADTIDIPLPLGAGTYLIANGGSRELVNAHLRTLDASVDRYRNYRGQSYGVDIVEIDAYGRRGHGLQPADPAAYEIYGNEVYAPCDGEVIASRSDRPDMPVPLMDVEVIEGNHVLLRCGDVDLLLAHLVPGSVRVEPGDTVSAGRLLARVGNSGNSSEPHLHVSAQRPGSATQPLSGEPVAILFDGRHPVRNMRIRVPAPAASEGQRGDGRTGLQERLAAELEALVREYGLPGAVAACVLADGAVATVAAGYADLEAAAPMTPSSRLLAGSIGKTFVSATMLALNAEGVLGLDDRLEQWLGSRPWYPRLPNHADITLRQLLMHTSGLADHVHMQGFADEFLRRLASDTNPFSPEELVGYLLDQPALFEAGQGWAYTDTGYILLGMVIEESTGNRYYDEVTRRFLQPLSLDRTSPSDRRELPGLASAYTGADNPFGLPEKLMRGANTLAWHPGIEWTGGGLVSNARDLAVWAKALFEGEAMDYEYLGELLRSAPMDPQMPGRRYGAGVAIDESEAAGTVYGHAGWVPGYVSFVRYLEDTRIALAFQTNTDAGLLDGEGSAIADIESRLTRVVTAGR
jgi:D-alanyl-D-alanine carboxypeptidase